MAEKKQVEDLQDITVSAKVIGEVCGIGDRMVRRYADEGVFKRNAHGRYELFQSVKNYITTLKVTKIGESGVMAEIGSERFDLNTEKAIHEHVRTMIAEIKLQLIKGQVHKSEDVERVITDMFAKFRSKIQSLPAKLAPRLEQKKKGEIQGVLKLELAGALEELAEYNPTDYYSKDYIEIKDEELFSVIKEDEDG